MRCCCCKSAKRRKEERTALEPFCLCLCLRTYVGPTHFLAESEFAGPIHSALILQSLRHFPPSSRLLLASSAPFLPDSTHPLEQKIECFLMHYITFASPARFHQSPFSFQLDSLGSWLQFEILSFLSLLYSNQSFLQSVEVRDEERRNGGCERRNGRKSNEC